MAIVWLSTILGAPLVATLALLPLRGRAVRFSGWIAGLSSALSLIATLALLPELIRGGVPTFDLDWIPAARIRLVLHVDWLTFPFLLIETFVTFLTAIYTWGYHHLEERSNFFYALLLLFSVGMSGTTLANDMFLFYVFWELMLIASAVLIVVWGDGVQRGAVALKYFIFTHLGSLMVLVGLIVLYNATGTASFSALQGTLALAPSMVTTLTAMFLIGFCVKMAIFPLHLWLPDAHTVAPMPVTIMLAAAMLSMGTYGILRFPFAIFSAEQISGFAVPMMVAGIVSEVYGALMALAERDIKRIIAYSSVSQMGYILFGLGTMTYDGIVGATLHVIYHGLIKALLFMCVGLVIHATGRRNIAQLGGLGKAMPLVAVCTAIGALAIAGAPPFAVFNSEWMIFAGGFATAHIGLSVATLFGSLLTVAYALWFVGRIFFGEQPEGLKLAPPPLSMLVPTVLLAALALVEGLFPAPIFDWVSREMSLILGGGW